LTVRTEEVPQETLVVADSQAVKACPGAAASAVARAAAGDLAEARVVAVASAEARVVAAEAHVAAEGEAAGDDMGRAHYRTRKDLRWRLEE